MSTKTTIKRIALVAVSALGFGMISVVTPANAAIITSSNVVSSVSYSNVQQQSKDSVARVGVSTSFDLRVSTASSVSNSVAADANTLDAWVKFSSVPAAETSLGYGSNISPTLSVGIGSVAALVTGSSGLTVTTATSITSPTKVSLTVGSAGVINGSVSKAKLAQVSFTPNQVGTYKVLSWIDIASTGTTAGQLDTGEKTATKTIVVGGVPTTIVATLLNPASAAVGTVTAGSGSYTNNGSVFQVSVKDAAGNLTALIPGESVSVTKASGTGTISDASLTAGDFNKNGYAYVTISGTADQTGTFTFAGNGFTATSVTSSAASIASTNVASGVKFTQTTGVKGSSATTGASATSITSAETITFTTGKAVTMRVTAGSGATSTRYVPIQIVDSYGDVTGDNAIDATYNADGTGGTGRLPNYSLAVAIDDTLGYGSVTLPTAGLAAGDSIDVYVPTTPGAGQGFVVTLTAADLALDSASTLTPASSNIVTGGGITLTAQCLDQGLAPIPGCAVAWSVAGRNATTVPTQVIADANGYSTYTLTDTSTSTTSMVSTVSAVMSYGTSTNTETATVTFGASNAPAAIAVTTSPTLTVSTTESTISTAATGPANGAVTLAFTVTDSAGNVLVGTPVTFSADSANVVFKSSATDTSDRTIAYTSSAGVATTYIAGWVAPSTVTVTAKAGTKSVTTTVNFVTSATTARTIALSANGSVAQALVKDRYGNPVKGATVTFTRTAGTGWLGAGVSAQDVTTNVSGIAEILVNGSATIKAELSTTTYTQTLDAAGYVGTTATSGTGSTLAPKGVASATLDIAGQTASTDAVDAANEATDAANAATDAANAAAEAADAATAAAQDAQAAVAALASQVADLISGIKAQITALTNLVIKIQKKVKA